METVDNSANGSAEVLSECRERSDQSFCLWVFEKLQDGLGGDAAGVVATGQDAALDLTPAVSFELLYREPLALLEERAPVIVRNAIDVKNGEG
jgi:hypothetical protein